MFENLRLTEGQWKALLETARRAAEVLETTPPSSPTESSRGILDHVEAHVEVLKFFRVRPGVPNRGRIAAPAWVTEELERLIGGGVGK